MIKLRHTITLIALILYTVCYNLIPVEQVYEKQVIGFQQLDNKYKIKMKCGYCVIESQQQLDLQIGQKISVKKKDFVKDDRNRQ